MKLSKILSVTMRDGSIQQWDDVYMAGVNGSVLEIIKVEGEPNQPGSIVRMQGIPVDLIKEYYFTEEYNG